MIENTLFRREKELPPEVIQSYKDKIKRAENVSELIQVLEDMEDKGYFIIGSSGYSYTPSQMINAILKVFTDQFPIPTTYVTRALGLRAKVEDMYASIGGK